MKKAFIIICLLFTIAGYSQHKTKKLDSLFTQLYNQQRFYGNVLIAEKGIIIFQKSFGKANIEKNTDLDAESMFELASVSKQFTAMAIMILKKQGKISYEDSLRKFIPELPYNNITIRQLLNHISGMPDYIDLFIKNWDTTKIATNKDMINLLVRYKPAILFTPGEKWEYSNTGYALLASIIEKASGMDYGTYLKKNIFKPLDMKRTLVYRRRYEKKLIDNYAYGYVFDKNSKKFLLPDSVSETASMVYCLDGIVGDGTVNSTSNDLLKWDRALYTEKLIPKEILKDAFEPAMLNNGKTYDYGFGWGIGKFSGAGKILNHTGGWPGHATLIERHIETDKTIIILQNAEAGRPPLNAIRNILYGIKEEKPIQIKTDTSLLLQYTGEYELAPDFIITISTEKGKIFAQATGQDKFEIFPEKEDVFFLKVVEAKVKFIKDGKGIVKSLILYQNGQEIEGQKIK